MGERRVTTNLKIPTQVVAWLQATFVEDAQGALKKAEMYGEYERFCKECRMKPKDPNTFGKYVLRVFPTAYPSRLGSILDGSQAHCYSGISRLRRSQQQTMVPQKVVVPPTVIPVPTPAMEPVVMIAPVEQEEPQIAEQEMMTCPMPMAGVEQTDVHMVDVELEAMVEAMLAEADDEGSCCVQQPQSFVWWKAEQQQEAGCFPQLTTEESSSVCSSFSYLSSVMAASSTMYSEVPFITDGCGYDDFANAYDYMGSGSC